MRCEDRTVGTRDVGLLMIRLMLGVVFVFHGSQKLFGLFGGPGIEGFAGFLGQLGAPVPTVSALLAGGVRAAAGRFPHTGRHASPGPPFVLWIPTAHEPEYRHSFCRQLRFRPGLYTR